MKKILILLLPLSLFLMINIASAKVGYDSVSFDIESANKPQALSFHKYCVATFHSKHPEKTYYGHYSSNDYGFNHTLICPKVYDVTSKGHYLKAIRVYLKLADKKKLTRKIQIDNTIAEQANAVINCTIELKNHKIVYASCSKDHPG
ncbi:MAG: hypothetical protein AAGG80_01015 [Pseudomonadota bacterium]